MGVGPCADKDTGPAVQVRESVPRKRGRRARRDTFIIPYHLREREFYHGIELPADAYRGPRERRDTDRRARESRETRIIRSYSRSLPRLSPAGKFSAQILTRANIVSGARGGGKKSGRSLDFCPPRRRCFTSSFEVIYLRTCRKYPHGGGS